MINTEANADIHFENLYTAVLVFDRNLRLRRMNTAGENLLLTSFRKTAGLTAGEIFTNSPGFVENLQRTLETRNPLTDRGVAIQLPGNKTITVDCIFTPILTSGDHHELILEMTDTHYMSRFLKEESLSALHDIARESLRGMAHEIKNPLGGLRGAAQLLERELNDSELTEYTRIIIREADRLGKLIDRMLTPNGKLNIDTVNIHEILEYVQSLLEAESDNVLQIERDYDPSLPNLEADQEQLIQAIFNIFRNAVQAIPDDGHIWLNTRIKRMCTIRQHLYKLAVLIEIIDDGPGVPAEIENGLFYPMVTGRAEGTGLGLSIAQSLIQSHGGLVEYERVDQQTVFRILLPLRSGHDQE
jgi:two-component system nitrogen regulation sensor histidine kinase GlnL